LRQDRWGRKIFVFVSIANKLQVIDTNKREVLSTWPVTSQHPGDAAFDESTSRLLIGTHTPPEMIAMDSKSGKEVAHLPTAEGMDGVNFDSLRKRVYVSGGRDLPAGFAYVYQQKDADHYEIIGKVPTRGGAGTSFSSPELNRYYIAAPATDKEEAAILVYAGPIFEVHNPSVCDFEVPTSDCKRLPGNHFGLLLQVFVCGHCNLGLFSPNCG
jgi:hypothetical protein